ncbi:MAG: hypothetical protein AMXMBFR13_38980 [Phycisphaerae bacterium]
MRFSRYTLLILLLNSFAAADPPLSSSIRLGVDDAGSYLHATTGKHPWEFPAFFRALDDLGARFVSTHFWPVSNAGQDNAARTGDRFAALDAAFRKHNCEYAINVELSNWLTRLEITPGVNEFEHSNGTHRWDLRMDWLAPLLPPKKPGKPALIAITYDECEHMLLSNNRFSNAPKSTFDKPYLVPTHGLPLEAAYDRLVAEARRIREEHYAGLVRPQTEQVWPDLFHLFARAGWIVTPKLLKENISPVVMSIALGAAIQYEDEGATLWASPDLWHRNHGYPGHSPQALRSALLLGYWLGAETVYVENLDFPKWTKRHPLAELEGSLIAWSSPEEYRLTAYGEVVREFYREYVPAHPRAIGWQNYDPRVAIIRLPDGGWGQFSPEPGPGEVESRNRLLGNRDMPLDEPASEWLHVWPILTHGVARPGAISINNPRIYPQGLDDFFAPIDSVAVFDHHVTAKHLRNVDCLIVCGHALSSESFTAIRERVAAGATCIIARRLYNRHAKADLPGDWLVVDDFKDPRVAETLQPFIGRPEVARFRFKHHLVEFQKGTEPDSIRVNVTPRTP